MSRCPGQLGLQNVTVAACPVLSLFMEALRLIDGEADEQITRLSRHVNKNVDLGESCVDLKVFAF